jgi:hypothetical protein
MARTPAMGLVSTPWLKRWTWGLRRTPMFPRVYRPSPDLLLDGSAHDAAVSRCSHPLELEVRCRRHRVAQGFQRLHRNVVLELPADHPENVLCTSISRPVAHIWTRRTLDIGADRRQVQLNGDARLLKDLLVSNTAKLEDLRCFDRPINWSQCG